MARRTRAHRVAARLEPERHARAEARRARRQIEEAHGREGVERLERRARKRRDVGSLGELEGQVRDRAEAVETLDAGHEGRDQRLRGLAKAGEIDREPLALVAALARLKPEVVGKRGGRAAVAAVVVHERGNARARRRKGESLRAVFAEPAQLAGGRGRERRGRGSRRARARRARRRSRSAAPRRRRAPRRRPRLRRGRSRIRGAATRRAGRRSRAPRERSRAGGEARRGGVGSAAAETRGADRRAGRRLAGPGVRAGGEQHGEQRAEPARAPRSSRRPSGSTPKTVRQFRCTSLPTRVKPQFITAFECPHDMLRSPHHRRESRWKSRPASRASRRIWASLACSRSSSVRSRSRSACCRLSWAFGSSCSAASAGCSRWCSD